jgi:hypothetical protein
MAANLTIGSIWIDVSISEKHTVSAEVSSHPVETGEDIVDNIRPTPRQVAIEGLVTNHPIELPLSHAGSVAALEDAGVIDVTTVPGRRLSPMSQEIEGEPDTLGFIPGLGQAGAIAGLVGGALGIDVTPARRRYAAERYNEDREGTTFFAVNALAFSEEFDRVGAVYAALTQVVALAQPVKLVTGLDVYESVALTDLTFDRSSDIGPNALRFSATCTVLRIVSARRVAVPLAAEQRGKPGQSRGKQTTTPTDPNALSPAAQAQVRKASLLEKFFE